jgi:general stress protein 26
MLDTHQQGFAKLVAMIEALDVGMLTTADRSRTLRSRPMATQSAENGELCFFTSEESPKIAEIGKDAHVNVSYADPNNQTYVSVSGIARTSHDTARIKELWSERVRRWFPKGPDDPRLALLTVEISQAEYWDVDAGAMVNLVDRGASAEEIIAATDHRKMA